MIRYLRTHRFCSSTWTYESDSDGDEFEGYLGPDDGPVVIRAIDSAGYEDQEPESPPYRSRSLDSLTVIGGRKAIYYRETGPLVHESGAARGDDAMASMTNMRILYRRYIRRSKIHYNLDSKGISYEPCCD